MLLRKCSFVPVSPSPHYESRETVIREGFPPRVVSISTSNICTNSESFRCSFPDFDPDDLEKQILVGKDLTEVNSLCFDKQFVDPSEMSELREKLTEKTE